MISFMGTGAEGKKIVTIFFFSECHQCFVKLEAEEMSNKEVLLLLVKNVVLSQQL